MTSSSSTCSSGSTHEPAAPPGGGGLVRVRLDLSYDGSAFAGWARQPGLRTVQGELERALALVLRLPEAPVTTVAGRTDAGVHARGQVAHVDVPEERLAGPGPGLASRLAGVLPADVRVRDAQRAPAGFDARFSALWRRYAYRVSDDPWGVDPLHRHEVLWHRRRLDVATMHAAAQPLLGEHDFAAFCRRREGATTVRGLHELSWRRDDDGLAVARVVADAFCHSMVRALVGCLLAVGDGRRRLSWPQEVLAGRRRDPAVAVVAPHGLVLEEVGYPPADQLEARAREARRVRTSPGSPRSAPAPPAG